MGCQVVPLALRVEPGSSHWAAAGGRRRGRRARRACGCLPRATAWQLALLAAPPCASATPPRAAQLAGSRARAWPGSSAPAPAPLLPSPAGFPLRSELQDSGTFETHSGRGVLGGDLECNGTLVPGRCAVAGVTQAAILCGTWPDCDAAVHYSEGESARCVN